MIDDLPVRPFTALAPPPAGAVVAVRAGRSIRRRRRLTGAGAAAASVVLVAGVVAASGGGSTHAEDQLVPAHNPKAASASPEPAAVRRRGGAGAPTAGPAPAARADALPGTLAGAPPAAGTSDSGKNTGSGQAPQRGYRTPPLRRTYLPAPPQSAPNTQQGPGGRICSVAYDDSGRGGAVTTDWCLTPHVTSTAHGHDLTIEVCRDSTGPGQLTFSRQSEVDLAVLAGSKTVWRWSVGQPDAAQPHSLQTAADSCWSWTAPWTDVNAAGRALPRGSYTLAVTSAAGELQALHAQTTAFSIS
jgi:hypothetical protein